LDEAGGGLPAGEIRPTFALGLDRLVLAEHEQGRLPLLILLGRSGGDEFELKARGEKTLVTLYVPCP
jgi:hypothetical protein